MANDKVQNYPTVDSAPSEPFESLVEMYYQLKGYITSSNKWFWVHGKGKRQRGYHDIDVLAIKGDETLIISVTGNLDDKVRFGRDGELKKEMVERLTKDFEQAETYLKEVKEYAWLVKGKVRKVIAYAYGGRDKRKIAKIEEELKNRGIELIHPKEIIGDLKKEIEEMEKKGLNTRNQLVKTIQLFIEYDSKGSR